MRTKKGSNLKGVATSGKGKSAEKMVIGTPSSSTPKNEGHATNGEKWYIGDDGRGDAKY